MKRNAKELIQRILGLCPFAHRRRAVNAAQQAHKAQGNEGPQESIEMEIRNNVPPPPPQQLAANNAKSTSSAPQTETIDGLEMVKLNSTTTGNWRFYFLKFELNSHQKNELSWS